MLEIITGLSVLVFALAAVWFGRPFLRRLGRAQALTFLVGIHILRYSALLGLLGQQKGDQSGASLLPGVIGDLIGAAIALVTVFCLHRGWRLGVILSWVLVAETIGDFVGVSYRQAVNPTVGDPSGVVSLVVGYLVPLLIVSLPLIVWQLISRRREPLVAPRQSA
jgi:hypothetical protein